MAFKNDYVVGKGRLYFDRFPENARVGAGLRYLGNTPALTVSRSATVLDHYDSDAGIKQKDDSIDIQTDAAGKFQCDNITGDNLALFFGGDASKVVQTASASALTETITATRDSYFRVGRTVENPAGLRSLADFTATAGTTALDEDDFEFNPNTGLLYIKPTSTAVPGTGAELTLSYKTTASSNIQVVERGTAIYGELYFESDNPRGRNRDFLWPYVKLTADGEMALKGDTWMVMAFNFEILRLNDSSQRVYITERAA